MPGWRNLIEASRAVKGQKVSPHVKAMVVPGSQMENAGRADGPLTKSSLMPAFSGGSPDAACALE